MLRRISIRINEITYKLGHVLISRTERSSLTKELSQLTKDRKRYLQTVKKEYGWTTEQQSTKEL